jgi:serine/threonine-protein kinase
VDPSDRLVADRFRMIRRLGAGAMASVFLAEDCELGRMVAIKRLHPDSPDELAPRFRREMRVAASLSHPNVVTVFDAIADDGAVLLVMEYVEGPTLAQRMADGPLSPDEALRIARSLAEAVDYLHAQGIVHRDVKPANVLLDGSGHLKLTDLGIASAAEATGITTSGTVLGTPAYMAPELFDGERATGAADVYSVAAIAFEMLSGHRAREGGTPAAMALRANDPPPELRDHLPDAPALSDALARGMARDPADRPASATELVDDLEAALAADRGGDGQPAVTGPAPAPPGPEAGGPPPAPAPQRTAEVEVPASPPRAPRRDRRERRRSPVVLLAAAGALAAAAIAAVLIAGGGAGPGDRSGSTPGTDTQRSTTTAAPRRSRAATDTPAGAVRAFYGRAAAHRYDDAWALAAPSLRAQLGGFDAFRGQFSAVRSIEFARAETVRRDAAAATVAISTTATHTDRVDRCTGTAETAPGPSGGWRLTRLNVSC